MRGGVWLRDPAHCRSAYRGGYYRDLRSIGFRVAVSPPKAR